MEAVPLRWFIQIDPDTVIAIIGIPWQVYAVGHGLLEFTGVAPSQVRFKTIFKNDLVGF